MAIEFACTACQQPVRVADAAAGKKGKCPHCGAVVQIPGATPSASSVGGYATPTPSPASSSAVATPRKGNNLTFPCPTCAKPVTAPASLAGKRGKCPHCQGLLTIGGGPAPPRAPSTAGGGSVGLTALNSLTPVSSGLTPLDTGLTPLDTGLTPLGGLAPLGPATAGHSAGLPPLNPLDDLPSLSTLPPAAGGGAPYGKGPAASLNPLGASPSALGASPLGNPLGTPVGGAYTLPSSNPYASPRYPASGGGGATAPPKLMIPAIAMIVISTISILVGFYQAFMVMLTPIVAPPNLDEAGRQGYVMGFITAYVVAVGLIVLINGIIIFGSVQMIRMRGLGSAKAAGILALLPCSPCCANLPFAIWALVVLGQDDVWRRFKG